MPSIHNYFYFCIPTVDPFRPDYYLRGSVRSGGPFASVLFDGSDRAREFIAVIARCRAVNTTVGSTTSSGADPGRADASPRGNRASHHNHIASGIRLSLRVRSPFADIYLTGYGKSVTRAIPEREPSPKATENRPTRRRGSRRRSRALHRGRPSNGWDPLGERSANRRRRQEAVGRRPRQRTTRRLRR